MARADVVTVTPGLLTGYEIKGDADDLGRLRRQVGGYGVVLDRCWLVTGERWAVEGAAAVPAWWGVLAWEGSRFLLVRAASPNPAPTPAMLDLLWTPELRLALALLGERVPARYPKHGLETRLRSVLGPDGALAAARGMLARRAENGWGMLAIAAAEAALLGMEAR